MNPRFVIFSSYGNDSVALIQWAHEEKLNDVAVVYTDTKWAASGWAFRVEQLEYWVQSLVFSPYQTSSIGFVELARQKKGFPTQRYQWCSFILKIEPGQRWLAEHDPECRAVCLIGVRREESAERAKFPAYMANSPNHGGRVTLAPFVDYTTADRDTLLRRAGVEPLPHRSRECKCINANKADLVRFTPDDVASIRAAEAEIGKNMYRPRRHMGASGVDEVVKWAHSDRGQYQPPEDDLPDENMAGCNTGFCE